MKEFILNEDLKIIVEKQGEDNYKVSIYEFYINCGWRYLFQEFYNQEALEYKFDIQL